MPIVAIAERDWRGVYGRYFGGVIGEELPVLVRTLLLLLALAVGIGWPVRPGALPELNALGEILGEGYPVAGVGFEESWLLDEPGESRG